MPRRYRTEDEESAKKSSERDEDEKGSEVEEHALRGRGRSEDESEQDGGEEGERGEEEKWRR